MPAIFDLATRHLGGRHSNRLSWGNACLNPARCQLYAAGLVAVGCPINTICCFIGATARPTCRPHTGQRSVYNGWGRLHAFKWQSIAAPDGVIASLCGPFVGRRNDRYMIQQSAVAAAFAAPPPGFAMFGDKGYTLNHPVLYRPPRGQWAAGAPQHAFNLLMSTLRVTAGWPFGGIAAKFPFLDPKLRRTRVGLVVG